MNAKESVSGANLDIFISLIKPRAVGIRCQGHFKSLLSPDMFYFFEK